MRILATSVISIAALLGSAVVALATPVNLAFPSSSTAYVSATNGNGTIPSGGKSESMWTTGDNVSQTFTGVGLSSTSSLSYSFAVENILGSTDETLNIVINGITVGSAVVHACGFCHTTANLSDSIVFPSIVGNGTYQLAVVLANTIPGGDGSIAFFDGGTFTLDGQNSTAAPEPATIALLGAGLGALAMRRRKRRGQSL